MKTTEEEMEEIRLDCEYVENRINSAQVLNLLSDIESLKKVVEAAKEYIEKTKRPIIWEEPSFVRLCEALKSLEDK